MKKIIPINVTAERCAFAIRTGYERHAYLNGMTRGGGFYPATGVLEIYEKSDTDKHGQDGLLQDNNDQTGTARLGELSGAAGTRRLGLPDDKHNGGL